MLTAATTPVAVSVAPAASNEELREFIVYHFNGLEGHGNAHCECQRLTVKLMAEDDGRGEETVTEQQGLREVLWTRWAAAIIHYEDNAHPPRIS